jgi:ribosomal protein S7
MKIITNALSARRPDWKRKRAVKVMPPRKPGDPNPVLRASIENTFDTFGMDGEPNMNPLERLEEILRRLGPRPEVDQIRETVKEIQSPPRGRPARRDGRSFRIAREVADRRITAAGQKSRLSMKKIYGEVAKHNVLSATTVRDFYLKHRDIADLVAKPRS